VDALPDDAPVRREGLERWAEVQRQRTRPAPLRLLISLAVLVRHWLRRVATFPDRVLDWFADRVLDRGLKTSGGVFLPEHVHLDRVEYVPSRWHWLPRALRYVDVSDRDTFVDFGCGKGRIVHQAAKRPFGRVIGVEISPELAEVARKALGARSPQHRCRDVEIVVSDLTQFVVPDDLTTAYFFRPVKSAALEVVLRNIVDSIDRRPRRVRLIYVWPTRNTYSTILATGRFRLLKELRSGLFNRRSFRVSIFESL
jgi:hypothetical protein